MKTIGWGIIGLGEAVESNSGPAFRLAQNSKVVSVMRRTGHLAEDYARRHNVPKWSNNADDILRDPDVDAVYIATYTNTHLEYTKRAAAAGKAVYVEKPMAMTSAECEEMVDVCRRAGVPLWVAHYRRCLPRFLKLKELIDGGAIGNIRFVRSERWSTPQTRAGGEWTLDPKINSGGRFFETASHVIDLLDMLFGPAVDIRGIARNLSGTYKVPDTVSAAYRFQSGAMGCGVWCYAADSAGEANEIVGEKGRILFKAHKTDPIRLIQEKEVTELAIDDPEWVQLPIIQSMVDELNGQGKCPCDGESGARSVRMMEGMLGLN